VSDVVVLQYVGFETKGTVCDTFTLRGSGRESSEYSVAIENAAFIEHRVRYQDAPDICSIRLRRELSTHTGHLPSCHFFVTDVEMADYKSAHTPKTKPSRSAHSEDNRI
jgi:hypothetical protein